MEMKPLESRNLKAYGYSGEAQVLRVEFDNGGRYEYSGVPASLVEEFVASPSKGLFFASNIRGKFDFTKLEPEPKA